MDEKQTHNELWYTSCEQVCNYDNTIPVDQHSTGVFRAGRETALVISCPTPTGSLLLRYRVEYTITFTTATKVAQLGMADTSLAAT